MSPLLLTASSPTSEGLKLSIVKWLHDNTIIYQNPFNELKNVIFKVFGSVDVITALYHDPDENWSKVTIDIASHFGNDFEAQFSKEDELFSEIGNCQTIRKILPHLIIRQI